MGGPNSPNPTVGGETPGYSEQPVDFPRDQPPADMAFPPHPRNEPPYPVPTPPPGYPRRQSARRLVIGTLAAVALVAALTAAIVYGARTNGANTGASFSEAAAKTAIQNYLDALESRNTEEISRNALCGMYDGVRDRRSDQALAKLSSDAIRKQFSQVQLTSIDKIVYLSQYQAQALFTIQVAPASGGPLRGQVQGVAQLLFQRGQILVCSYVLRTGGSY
ncbi:Rv0361 family membrane protein [Mycobacterium tilburgii]|uniref:Rv0361 family membrane protein n=1 Tax=Mycobacterium tilburgii TaxID=44467 RepID=UPI0011844CFF|nr:hypothetical protein [Mycobacterium tilburgii]